MPTRDVIRASSMQRVAICPGSHAATYDLPSDTNAAAERGTRIHDYLAKLVHLPGLMDVTTVPAMPDPDEQETANQLIYQLNAMLTLHAAGAVLDIVEAEHSMTMPNLSGTADLILRYGDRTVLVDWKTGMTAQVPAAQNAQLRAYAVMYANEYPSTLPLIVAIVTPTHHTVAWYLKEDLLAATMELNEIITAAIQDKPTRIPSEAACKYCRAFGTSRCPETQTIQLAPGSQLPAIESVKTLAPVSLVKLLDALPMVEKAIEAIKAEARARLESAPDALGNEYYLAPGRSMRVIEDTAEAFINLPGIQEQDFFSACKLSLPELERAVAKSTGKKPKEAKALIQETIGHLITTKDTAPVIRKRQS